MHTNRSGENGKSLQPIVRIPDWRQEMFGEYTSIYHTNRSFSGVLFEETNPRKTIEHPKRTCAVIKLCRRSLLHLGGATGRRKWDAHFK